MSDKRYLGNIITQNPTAPAGDFANSAAKGVWSLEEQLAYQKAGLWPVPGKFLNVEDVFSTYLYTGTGSNIAIDNGIDLSGEGGLVWYRRRDGAENNSIEDTVRGLDKVIYTDSTNAQADPGAYGLQAFNSNGFTAGLNTNGGDYVSWTFRKAPKFFDVVTYTGDGVNFREIPHNLGSAPGLIIIKCLNSAESWMVYHKDLAEDTGTTPSSAYSLSLNGTGAASTLTRFQYSQSDTVFKLAYQSAQTNANGNTYVAYLFAHNNNDGDFGPDGDADIIKCGVATISGDTTVDLGFEPQWVLYKNASANGNWTIIDSMRGWTADGAISALYPNTSGAESAGSGYEKLTSTGFVLQNYTNGHNYVYVAIRRGTAVPTSATEVFDIKTSVNTNPAFTSDHVIDLAMFTHKTSSDNRYWSARLASRGYLFSNATNAEATNQAAWDFGDTQFGHYNATGLGTNYLGYFWKRAPNYMDVVAFTGTGSAGTHNHNLTIPAEMMWVKSRAGNGNWFVYHSGLGATKYLFLNETSAAGTASSVWNDTAPTSSVFSVGASVNQASASIAYLFATLAGISKVGSVTHSGTTNVDCGFTSGASLVMLKRTDSTGDWYWWDSTSGIIAGNDPYFILNGQAPQVTNTDYIDPLSSGFTITSSFTAGDYIFYAIA